MSARQQGFQENECFQKLRLTEFQTDISGISRPISINRVLNTNLTSIVSQLSKCAEPTNSKSFGTCLRANLCQILKSKSATKLQLNNRIGLALFILSNHFISFELIHQELIQNWFYYSVLNKLYFCVIGLKRFFFLGSSVSCENCCTQHRECFTNYQSSCHINIYTSNDSELYLQLHRHKNCSKKFCHGYEKYLVIYLQSTFDVTFFNVSFVRI